MLLGNGASTGRSIEEYRKRRFDRAIARLDAKEGEGRWITTENGHHVHLNEEGEPDKGNPYVLAAARGEHRVATVEETSRKVMGVSKPRASAGKQKLQKSAKRIREAISKYSEALKERRNALQDAWDAEEKLKREERVERSLERGRQALKDSGHENDSADDLERKANELKKEMRDKYERGEKQSAEEVDRITGEINKLKYFAEVKRDLDENAGHQKVLAEARDRFDKAKSRIENAENGIKSSVKRLDNELARRNIDKMRFLDEKERDDIATRVKASRCFNEMDKELRERCEKSLEKASDAQLTILNATIDKASIEEVRNDEPSHYNWGIGRITLNKDDNPGPRTFWHEYGHLLDDAGVSGIEGISGIGYGASTLSNDLRDEHVAHGKDACEDWNGILRGRYGDRYRFEPNESGDYMKLIDTETGDAVSSDQEYHIFIGVIDDIVAKKQYEELDAYKKSVGVPDVLKYEECYTSEIDPKTGKVTAVERFDGAAQAYTESLDRYYDAIDRIRREHPDYDKTISRLSREADKFAANASSVCDILSAMTHGRALTMNATRKDRYFEQGSSAEIEMVADYHQLRIMDDQKAIAFFERIAPKTAKNMRRLYDRWLWGNVAI